MKAKMLLGRFLTISSTKGLMIGFTNPSKYYRTYFRFSSIKNVYNLHPEKEKHK